MESDIENFWIRIYFNPRKSESLQLAIVRRAYRDLNRTLRNVSKQMNPKKFELVANFVSSLTDRFLSLKSPTIDSFDDLHKNSCYELKQFFIKNVGFENFTIGQSQKWLNMTLKYLWVVKSKFPKIVHIQSFLHCPIDNIMLKEFQKRDIYTFPVPWSKLDNYKDYFKVQRDLRKHIKNESIIEFELTAFNRI